jgi:dihydroorotate dehydrogenase electron transfer subunit
VSERVQAPLGRRLLKVTGMQQLGAYHVLSVADPDGPTPQAGQFAMLATAELWGGGAEDRPHLPRAFSVARFKDGEAQFLLEDVGPGTRRLCELRAGDGLWVLGPLGLGFSAPPAGQRAILVGGGVGIAPLAIWQDQLEDQCSVLLGFRDAAHTAGAALLRAGRVATDDGSQGHHGLVTDLLVQELEHAAGSEAATVYACGPPPMLEAVRAICEQRAVPAQLALESGMACGFGACFGCVVPKRGGGYLRVCVDGPVVDAGELERVHSHGGHAAIGQA